CPLHCFPDATPRRYPPESPVGPDPARTPIRLPACPKQEGTKVPFAYPLTIRMQVMTSEYVSIRPGRQPHSIHTPLKWRHEGAGLPYINESAPCCFYTRRPLS